jgi:serine/threonine protein kinase
MPTDLRKARELFLHAIGKLPAEQWDRYVAEACEGDAELEKQLQYFLQVHRDAGSFMEQPAEGVGATGAFVFAAGESALHGSAEAAGSLVGAYKLVEEIGEGGMGTVWMAQQTEPVKRLVALKVIKPGMDSRQVIARFEAERQALALMDHPHIARVLDGGQSGSGRPYFVMDLVKGLPITEYCDQNQLMPRERLGLFLQICSAVQHAHQKGIIHRDLKPSNVLVTVHDTRPVVKVIDFGVAKAVGRELTDKTLCTGFAQMIGTPLYMSPEQAGQSGLDIDTRSDVYSLGVLLYELLTGTTPFERDRFKEMGSDELRRVIREEEPPRPSTRISTLGQAATTVSAQRRSDPKRLSQLFRGELDWIVMKALEKDRNRRYESASAFAADVTRYLHDAPVQACPPSVAYRLRKFVRRNKRSLAIVGLLAVMLLVTVIVQAVNNWRLLREQAKTLAALDDAEKNRTRAREALDQMCSRIIDDWLGRQPRLTTEQKEFLELALARYEEFTQEVADTPSQRCALAWAYFRVGHIRRALHLWPEARAALERSRELFEALLEEHPGMSDCAARLAMTHNTIAQVELDLGRHHEALSSHESARVILAQVVRDHPEEPGYRATLAMTHGGLAAQQQQIGKWHEALRSHDMARALYERLVQEYPGDPKYAYALAIALTNRAVSLSELQNTEEAMKSCELARSLVEPLVRAHPDVRDYIETLARAHNHLGMFQGSLGRREQALNSFKAAIALRERLFQDYPSMLQYAVDLGGTYRNLGELQTRIDKLDGALASYEQAIATLARTHQREPRHAEAWQFLVNAYVGQAEVLGRLGRRKDMLKSVEAMRAIVERQLQEPPDRQNTTVLADTHNKLCGLYLTLGQRDEALKSCHAARALREKLVKDHRDVPQYAVDLGGTYCNLANLAKDGRDSDGALKWYERAIATLEPVNQGPGRPRPLTAALYLSNAYNGQGITFAEVGRPKEALASYRLACAINEQLVRDHPGVPDYAIVRGGTYCNIGNLLKNNRDNGGALDWYDRAIASLNEPSRQKSSGRARFFLANSHEGRADALVKLGRPKEARTSRQAECSLREQLVRDNPGVLDIVVALGGAYCNLANLVAASGDKKCSLIWYARAIATLQPASQQQPRTSRVVVYLRNSHWGRGYTLNDLGQHAGALEDLDRTIALDASRNPMFGIQRCVTLGLMRKHAQTASAVEEMASREGLPAKAIYDLACIYCLCVPLAARDADLSAAKRGEVAERYAARTVALLRQATQAGYKDLAQLRKDAFLNPLRQREDFTKLIAELEGKTKR